MSQTRQDDFEPQFLEALRKERRDRLFERDGLILFAIIVGAVTLVGIASIPFQLRKQASHEEIERGIRAEASVVERDGKEYTYQFSFEGETYRGSGTPDRAHRREADETGVLEVFYLPGDPGQNRPVHERPPDILFGLRFALGLDLIVVLAALSVFLQSLVRYLKNRRDARLCLRVIEPLTDADRPVSPRALLQQIEKEGCNRKCLSEMREFLITGCDSMSAPQCLWTESIPQWQERQKGDPDTHELLRRYAFALRFIYRIQENLPPIPDPPQLPARIPHDDPEGDDNDRAPHIARIAHMHALELTRQDPEGHYLCDRLRINIESLPRDDERGGSRGENPYAPKPGFSSLDDIKHIPYRLWKGHWPREERKKEIEPPGIEAILSTAFAGNPYASIEAERNREPTRAHQPALRIQWPFIKAILYFFYFPMFAEEPVTREFLLETPDGREERVRISYEPHRQILFERVGGADVNGEVDT